MKVEHQRKIMDVEASILSHAFQPSQASILFSALTKEDFITNRNALVFEAMSEAVKHSTLLSASDILFFLGKHEVMIGGANYIVELKRRNTSLDLRFLIQELQRLKQHFDLADECSKYIKLYQEQPEKASVAQAELLTRIYKSTDDSVLNAKDHIQLNSLETEGYELRNLALQGLPTMQGLKTDFNFIDDNIGGLQPGHLTIIGARPGNGKTTFMLNLVKRLQERRQLVITLEMTATEILKKLAFLDTSVDMGRYRKGLLSEGECKLLNERYNQIKSQTLFISEKMPMTPDQIMLLAKHLHSQDGLDIIYIDYLQLLSANGNAFENNQMRITEISRKLKNLAKQLSIPVVVLAQLNRRAEDEIPSLAHLRESGAIEADADEVLLLYGTDHPTELKVKLAKNRYGEAGRTFDLLWHKSNGGIENGPYG